jgi:hypothetical protein
VDRRVGNHLTGRKERAYGKARAADIAVDFVRRKFRMVNAALNADGDYPDSVAIPQIKRGTRGPAARAIGSIAVRNFMELAGWYLSEGYCDALDGRHGGRITICQTAANPGYREEIIQLFGRVGLGVQVQERAIVGHNKALAAFLVGTFGAGSHHKFIPQWVKRLHPDLLKVLRDTMMKGDGGKRGFDYTSYSPQLRDDFQYIAFATGWGTAIRGNVVRIGQRQTFPEIREAPAELDYEGMIGCATVPNGTLVVRRNGIVCVSGNCDFGHTDDNGHFWRQMDFLTPELCRALKPGRIACIHVKDRVLFGQVTGAGIPTISPFHAEALFHYRRHGLDYCGMITVVTDVVRENNGTYRLGYTEMRKDGTKMGVGCPEYVLLFHKPQSDRSKGFADQPVTKTPEGYSLARWQLDAHSMWRSSGNRLLSPAEFAAILRGLSMSEVTRIFERFSLAEIYDHEYVVALGEALGNRLPKTFMALAPPSAHPAVWHDVARMRTLNGAQSAAGRELHVCPLQLDIIERLIARFSNPGETVYDPFGGLMSVPYVAVKAGRIGRAVELHDGYFRDGVRYLEAAEREMAVPTLFDLFEMAEVA